MTTPSTDEIVALVTGILTNETFTYRGFTCEPLNDSLTRWDVVADETGRAVFYRAFGLGYGDRTYEDVDAAQLRTSIDLIYDLAENGQRYNAQRMMDEAGEIEEELNLCYFAHEIDILTSAHACASVGNVYRYVAEGKLFDARSELDRAIALSNAVLPSKRPEAACAA